MYNTQPAIPNQYQDKGLFLIKVTGEGELTVQPDSASINLGVITENTELIAAQKQNSQVTAKIIHSLLTLKIPQQHIQTFDYQINSDYDYEHGKQIFRGYKVTHMLQIQMEDLTLIGIVVDTGVQNGVNYVSNVHFKAKHKDTYFKKALSLALNNALEKAQTIAGTLNGSLIPTPILVTEAGAVGHPFFQQSEPLIKAVSSSHFEPGQIVIKTSILAEFQYHPV